MPPLSGFLAKFMLIAGLFRPEGAENTDYIPAVREWIYVAMIILSGIASLIVMTRAGVRIFWASIEGRIPKVQMIEVVPVLVLLFLCLVLTLIAEPVMRYLNAMAASLHTPMDYIRSVLGGFPRLEGGRPL